MPHDSVDPQSHRQTDHHDRQTRMAKEGAIWPTSVSTQCKSRLNPSAAVIIVSNMGGFLSIYFQHKFHIFISKKRLNNISLF